MSKWSAWFFYRMNSYLQNVKSGRISRFRSSRVASSDPGHVGSPLQIHVRSLLQIHVRTDRLSRSRSGRIASSEPHIRHMSVFFDYIVVVVAFRAFWEDTRAHKPIIITSRCGCQVMIIYPLVKISHPSPPDPRYKHIFTTCKPTTFQDTCS